MSYRFPAQSFSTPPGGWRRLLGGTLAFAIFAVASACDAGKVTPPSWMKAEAAKKKVEFHFISGFNANNSAWNFNGYYEGGATIVVPVDWNVEMTLFNQDGNYPHSMVVTKAYAPGEFPEKAGREEAAIKRAFTTGPIEGLFAGDEDTLRFKAKSAGAYYLLCGVPGHARAGMWIKLEISAEADAPYVEIADGVAEGRA
jgi:sulfocyanin